MARTKKSHPFNCSCKRCKVKRSEGRKLAAKKRRGQLVPVSREAAPILTDAGGRPIARPRRAEYANDAAYFDALRARQADMARASEEGVREGLRRGLAPHVDVTFGPHIVKENPARGRRPGGLPYIAKIGGLPPNVQATARFLETIIYATGLTSKCLDDEDDLESVCATLASAIEHRGPNRKMNPARRSNPAEVVRDDFLAAYVDVMLWSTPANADSDETYEQLGYTINDFSPSLLKTVVDDCDTFQKVNADLLQAAYANGRGYGVSDAGHDFWLTREGHGAGFWDRGLGEIGDELTKRAKLWGSFFIYIGDDGKLYGS